MQMGILFFLAFPAYTDWKRRTVFTLPVLAAAALLGICRCLQMQSLSDLLPALTGMLPGLFFFFLSLASRGAVGGGDALIILLLGLLIGFWDCLALCLLALLLVAGCGLLLIAAGKANRKTELPFIPFLLLAYVILLAAAGQGM